jgi:hypothetical protein
MEALEGEEVYLLLIHDLGTKWAWLVSVTPLTCFTPGERTPGTHWTGGWVGPRAGLDTEARRRILCPCRGSNLYLPVVQFVARHYTAWATRLPSCYVILYKHKNKHCRLFADSTLQTLHCSLYKSKRDKVTVLRHF